MNSIRTYTRHALFLLLSLVAASCTAIDWVDPYYKEAAGITDPVTTAPASQYTITFDANGGTGTMNNLIAAEGALVNLTTNTYTMAGHAFLGWSTSSVATTADYSDGASYTMGNANVTLFAVWAVAQYTISFDANGGTGSISPLNTVGGQTVILTTNTLTRTGYAFLGWATTSGSTTAAYNNGASYTMGNSNVTLYAVWQSTTWTQQAYLKAPNAEDGDTFGNSVCVSNDTIVVAAFQEDSSQTTITNGTTVGADPGTASNSGAAYVFVRSGTTWSHQAYLKAPNAGVSDRYGESVSISGDTIVVGSQDEDSSQTTITNGTTVGADPGYAGLAGAAYVFTRSGTTWSHQAYLKAPNAGDDDRFGYSVSISGDTIVVGAYHEDSDQTTITNGTTVGADPGIASHAGAAYVFTRSGTTWSHQAYLKAPNAEDSDWFGYSVSISGDTIVVGANLEDSSETTITNGTTVGADPGTTSNSGAAYVFVRSGTTWSHQAYLKAPNAGSDDWFGGFVSVSGDTIVVGAQEEDSSQTTITNSTTVGADPGSAADAGAVYVFVRSSTNWSHQAYLKAPNAGGDDWFGMAVSISGDTTVVGAQEEDSSQTTITNSTTVGADPGTASNSGAAYVFVRSGTTWSHQAYLKAPNGGAGDRFGASVSVSGDTIVVGAWGEDSSQNTITNNITGSSTYGTDASANENVGAAYVFVR